MKERDASEAFLDGMPELAPGGTFCFACHPGVRCFNACCSNLNLVLTPYDALRLRRALGLGGRAFAAVMAEVAPQPDTGFPVMRLRMLDDPERSCPFVRPEGCAVYADRPAACRTYPLGRATRQEDFGMALKYFVVREPHCLGFDEKRQWTAETWTADQGLEPYNEANDRFTALLSRIRERGLRLDGRLGGMALLALYQPDDFQEFVRRMRLFDQLDVPEQRQQAVLGDEAAALDLGLHWMELLLLGGCENLSPRDPK